MAPTAVFVPATLWRGDTMNVLECNSREYGWLGSFRSLALTFPRRWLAHRATVNIGVSPHVTRRIELPRSEIIWNGVRHDPIPIANSRPHVLTENHRASRFSVD